MKNMFNLRFSKTAILTAIATFVLGESALAQSQVKWTGADIPNGNLNWSDPLNWSGGTPPGNIVIFPGAPFPATTNTIGATNNIVDQSMGITSLIYNNTNSASFPYFNTTFFSPGVTLTATGSIPLVVDGYAGGTEWDTTVNMAGTNYAFIVSNYTGTVWIGGTNAANVESATFALGDGTNIFDCGTFNLGNSDGGNGRQTTLKLGNGATTLSANTMNLGVSKAMGTIQFNTNVVAGSLAIYGTNGPTSRVATMTLGFGNSGTGGSIGQIAMTNTQPMSALVSTLIIGQIGNDTGTAAHGIVNFNNGTIDVTTLEMGLAQIGTTVSGSGKTLGNLLTVGGSAVTTATLIVNSPSGPGGGAFFIGACQTNNGATENSTFNIFSNGTAQVYCSILKYQAAFNTNTINIGTNGSGTLLLENPSNTIGTAAAPIDTINIDGTLGLVVNGAATSSTVFGTAVSANGGTILIEAVTNLAVLKSIPLISYNTANGDPFLGLTLAPLPTGYVGSLVDDGAGTISINIRPTSFVLVQLLWAGTAGSHTWDIGTSADWNNFNGSGSSTYTNPDEVAFDDTAANANVTLNTNVLPGALSFTNSSLNYVISGTGSIGGGALNLSKNGSASLRLSESGGDSFGGGISINGGTLILDNNNTIDGGISIASGTTAQVGNSDTSGNLPTGGITDNGSLVFDHLSGGTDTVAAAISGNGTVTLSGSGTVNYTVPNTYSGNTIVNAGTLALSHTGTVSSSANVAINNATLDVSGESASALPVTLPNNSTLNNSTITLAMPNQTAALFANEISLSGTITINVTALPPIASYPTTLTLAQTAFGLNGTFSLVRGSLPAGFSGTVSEGAGNTEILLTLSSGPIGVRPTTVWNATNGVSANINWSTAINWQLPGPPTPEDNVIFVDNGTAAFGSPYTDIGQGPAGVTSPGNITSTADTSFTVGTLTYTNVNLFQNTMIANGDSINVISNGSLTVGSPTTDFGGGGSTTATIGGSDATLNVNNTNGTMFVGEGSGATGNPSATLDLSGLATFNASVSRLLVGAGSSSEAIPESRESGTLYLAQTNDIAAYLPVTGTETSDTASNAVSLDIGDDSSNPSGTTSALVLGQTNVIFADAIAVGRQKQVATMAFNASFTGNNTAYFRGASTNGVGTWSIGDGVANSGTITASGTCDFTTTGNGGTGGTASDGYVNALVSNMFVGRGSSSTSSSGSAVGVLTFDNGVINVGTLTIGNQPAAAVKTATGTVNVNTNSTLGVSGTLTAATMNLGTTVSGGAGGGAFVNIGGGTVMVGSMICGGTNVTITLGANSAGGTLVITNPVAAPGIGTLALQGGTLQLSPANGLTNIIATNVTITAATKINIAALGTTVGGPLQVVLISYVGTDPGIGNLSIGTIPTGFSAPSLTDDGLGHIFLNITAPPVLSWVGAVGTTLNSTWDIGVTHNWAAGSTYANGDLVLFADTASNGVVDLTTALLPDSTSVSNNVLNYTFNGNGNITGNAFVKQGTGSLVVDNSTANNFSSVNIASGTVQLGNNDANGSLGTTPITDNGSLAFDQNVNNTFGNVVSGSGSLVQIGASVLTLGAANTSFSGTVMITNGVLNVTGTTGLGASTVVLVVTNGGTFDDNGISFNSGVQNATFVSGAGYNGQGAIINNGASQTGAFSNIMVSANVTFGGTNRWDIRAKTGTDASLNMYPPGSPYSITKVSSNEVALVNVGTIDAGLGNIFVQGGEFALQEGTVQLGNPASNIVVSAGANLELFALTTPLNKVITLNGNGTSDSLKVDSGGGADNTVSGPITLNGNCDFDVTASTVASTIQGIISGSGSLVMVGPGTLTLSNANVYTGATTINAGSLVLGSTGSIASSPAITLAGGATFNVSAVSGFTLGASQTLGNSSSTGTIIGSVNTGSGALALTYSSGTSSLLVTNGTLTLSGSTTVTVNNTGAQLAAGTYAIINSGTGGSIAGTAPSVTVTGNGAAGNASLSISGGTLNLVIAAGPPPQLHFTSINISGKTLTFSAVNGTANGPYALLSTTNLLLPLSQWTPVFTNSFDGSGAVNLSTNVVSPGIPNEYFIIKPNP